MKKWPVVLCLCVAVLGWNASETCAQMYVSGNVGVVLAEDSDISDAYDQGEISYDPGAVVTVAFGYAAGSGLRLEGELGSRYNEMDEISVQGYGSANIDGDVTTSSLMANIFFDILPDERISPFIGAGAGFANIEADLDHFGSDEDFVLAYQLAAGIGFEVTRQLKIDVQYRYFATEDPDFDGVDAEYATHNIMGGVRFSF